MGRKPSIDREAVLKVAEAIVSERGAAALTFDAVAHAAGITKGGVQSRFGTKEAMISAMLDRWTRDYDTALTVRLPRGAAGPAAAVAAHVDLTLGAEPQAPERGAALVAALLHNPEQLEPVRRWYADRFAGLFDAGEAAAPLRLALLATESIVMLRHLGLAELSDAEWTQLAADIAGLLTGDQNRQD